MVKDDALEAAPTRRGFVKLTVATSLVGVGLTTLGLGVSASDLRLRLEGFRARPGAPLKVVVEFIGRGSAPSSVGEGKLVSLDSAGRVESFLSSVVRLSSSAEALWEATIEAPVGDPLREDYHLAVAFVDAKGHLALSNPVEIVCTPFHAGY